MTKGLPAEGKTQRRRYNLNKSKEKENLETTAQKGRQNSVNTAGEQKMYCMELLVSTHDKLTGHRSQRGIFIMLTESQIQTGASCSCGRDRSNICVLNSDVSRNKMLLYGGRTP